MTLFRPPLHRHRAGSLREEGKFVVAGCGDQHARGMRYQDLRCAATGPLAPRGGVPGETPETTPGTGVLPIRSARLKVNPSESK